MSTAARREQRRLLGLRRAIHYTMAGAHPPVPARKPGSDTPGTTPIDQAIRSIEARDEQAYWVDEICDALYPETRAWR